MTETRNLSPLQWQLMMTCWKMNLPLGVNRWWVKQAFRIGGLALWATKLRRTNGPSFAWPFINFTGIVPEDWMQRAGKLYRGRPLQIRTRPAFGVDSAEFLALPPE